MFSYICKLHTPSIYCEFDNLGFSHLPYFEFQIKQEMSNKDIDTESTPFNWDLFVSNAYSYYNTWLTGANMPWDMFVDFGSLEMVDTMNDIMAKLSNMSYMTEEQFARFLLFLLSCFLWSFSNN